jgi:integrase
MSRIKKKASNGEGSIFKTKDGKWRASITIGKDPITGKQKKQTFYGNSEREVREKKLRALSQIQNGDYVEPSRLTLEQWLNIWLWDYKKMKIQSTTFESYEYIIRTHIIPLLGKKQLNKLKAEELQKLYNNKLKSGRLDGQGGLSNRSVKYIHIIMRQALSQAIKSGLLIKNVAEATCPPKLLKKEMRVLSIQEQEKFTAAIGNERLRALFILAPNCGAREGEILALKWSDINFEKCTVRIDETIKRVKTFDDSKNKTELIFKTPKTTTSNRVINVPLLAMQELHEHRKRQNEEKLKFGSNYTDNNLVFCTELGKPIDVSNLMRTYRRILKRSNIDLTGVTFHTLRHVFGSRLNDLNVDPKTIQSLMGHSSIKTTMDVYVHSSEEKLKEAADKMNSLFSKMIK